jgi:proton-translocating NADH-quinone oxidoreductase chain N
LNFGEPTHTLAETLWLLSPELVLLVAGVLIMVVDAIMPQQRERRWLPYAALAGLAGALIAAVTLWGCDTRVLYVLSCDPFGLMVKMIAMVALGIVVLASDAYIRARGQYPGVFYAVLLFSTLAISLLSSAVNLIMIYLAFEFLSITSYILTGYLRDDPRSTEGGLKYLLYGAGLSAVMLFGMSWVFGLTGSTDLETIATSLLEMERSLRPIIFPALIMVAVGFAFKVGAAPFHQWAPDAYEGAPTPVTAFLSVGPKIAGFALIVRVMLTMLPMGLADLDLDWQALLMAISAVTMTVGNLVAIWQQNVKRLLAYSSIAQAGYILIGVVAATPRGVTAVLLYLAAYALTNLGAFAAVIAFSNQTGSDEIEDYAGLSQRAPGVALILLICLLSLAGIPPTAGFVGKLYLFSAAIQRPGLLWLAVVGVINSVISLSYYWKLIRAMYTQPAQVEDRVEVSGSLSVALGMAVTGVLLIGIFPSLILGAVQSAAQIFFAG